MDIRKIKSQRKFNRKIYKLKYWSGYIEDAQKKQDEYKDRGYNARVIKNGGFWCVYIRKRVKKRRKRHGLYGICELCGKRRKLSMYYNDIAKTYQGLCKKCFEKNKSTFV